MQRRTAAATRPQPPNSDSASTTEAPTKTAPRFIATALSLVGDQNEVMEQMRCSEADFLLYRSGQKELLSPQLHRLVSLIVQEQRIKIAKRLDSLSALRAKRMRLHP